ncbi:MAG: hypothetical protein H0X16_07470 [Chloroflexi bacterium]|nr:hypothetical protein [Chloroflexota bacterium]
MMISVDLMLDTNTAESPALLSVRGGHILDVPADEGRFEAETWYRFAITINFESRRYHVEVVERGSAEAAAQLADEPWMTSDVPSVDHVCFQVPPAGEPASLFIDNLMVSG